MSKVDDLLDCLRGQNPSDEELAIVRDFIDGTLSAKNSTLAISRRSITIAHEREQLIAQYERQTQYVIELTLSYMNLFMLFNAIDGAADRYREDNLKSVLSGMINELTGAYGEFLHCCNRPNFKIEFDPELPRIYESHIQGIRNVLNDVDKGETLRANAAPGEWMRMLKDMREKVRLGRPRDPMTEVARTLLRHFEGIYGEGAWAKIGAAMKDYLLQQEKENPSDPEHNLYMTLKDKRGRNLRSYLKDL